MKEADVCRAVPHSSSHVTTKTTVTLSSVISKYKKGHSVWVMFPFNIKYIYKKNAEHLSVFCL